MVLGTRCAFWLGVIIMREQLGFVLITEHRLLEHCW